MQWMAQSVRNGRYLYCPQGSHLALYDDQQVYVKGLIASHPRRGRGTLPGAAALAAPKDPAAGRLLRSILRTSRTSQSAGTRIRACQ